MAEVRAEALAVEALRGWLLMQLPAKVDALNAARVAVLRAPRAGPYTITPGWELQVGEPGSEVAVELTGGEMTAEHVAEDINAVGIPGMTASADSFGRLVITADDTPAEDAPSVVGLGAEPEGVAINRAFGWPAGGTQVVRSALVAPGFGEVVDGEPDHGHLGASFWVVIGSRVAVPRQNIRSDIHLVTIQLEVLVAEPSNRRDGALELVGEACRAIREVILEDRTLGLQVHLTEIPSLQPSHNTWTVAGSTPHLGRAVMTVRVHVFERN